MSKHTAIAYLQVAPKTRRLPGDRVVVDGLDVVAMTKTPPSRPKPGTVTVKFNITLPDAVFLPLTPIVDATPLPVPVLDDEDGADG